jgi:Calcineurin-like phosphoesterase
MQLIAKTLPANHNIFLIGDIHEGTVAQSLSSLEMMKDMVLASKSNYVIIGGDLAEAITIDDKRYDVETIDSRSALPLKQYQTVLQFLKPLKKRILFVLEGNHDHKLAKFGNFVRDYICQELAVPYGTYTAKLSVRDKHGDLMYKLFYTHGAGTINSKADDPIRREANMQIILKRKLQHKAGDCIVMATAHNHKLLVAKPLSTLYLIDNGSEIIEQYTRPTEEFYIHPDHRWYCSTGSFMKLYARGVSSYAERGGYDPHELGFCIVETQDKQVYDVKKVSL